MEKDCERCGITFDSEGHTMGMWLTECGLCNKEQGRGEDE